LLELFRMLLSCKNEFRSINVFKDEEKGSVGKRKLELD
jgi:hypothetical protein